MYQRYQDAGGDVSKCSFGKYIKGLFPNVRENRKRFNGVKEYVFGLKERTENIVTDIEIPCDISQIPEWVTSPFFICKQDTEEIHAGFFGQLVNGSKTVNEIIFHSSGIWQLSFGGKDVNLEELSIDPHFICSKTSVENILKVVAKIVHCNGKEKENCHPDAAKCKYYIRECLGDTKNQSYRSINCKKAVSFLSLSQSCRNCQNDIRFTIDESNLVMNLSNKSNAKNHQEEGEEELEKEEEEEEEEEIVLTKENDKEMREVLAKVLPDASGEMLDLLVNQKKNLERAPSGRRWDKKTISLCLSLWCRSSKNYQQLRDSKVLILPHGNTLRMYKNCVDQQSGFHADVFLWMQEEAKKHYPSDGSFAGGICIDEMSIQEDLCMIKTNGEVRLVGFVDMGEESDNFNTLTSGKKERTLATHVLQFLYIGLNGFRFPFACFPVTQTKAGNLHFLFWDAVKFLNMYEFQVLFVSMDGAQTNRDFMKMFFADSSPLLGNFATKNIWSPADPDILFIMDYSHVIKRVRNNVLKSGTGKDFVRNLVYNQDILWEHWVNAFKWDHETNAFPLHRKLTHDHFFLTQESKMRNRLAEDVLSEEMLNLMLAFQKFLGEDGYLLNDTVALLKATSVIVSTFRDRRPIVDIEDKRLDGLLSALTWFHDWEAHVNSKKNPVSNRDKQLLSPQTREDLNSCIIGFSTLCKNTLRKRRNSIVPARINSDVIENIFCQQRGIINGNNTNPTFYQYVKNINTVIIGQNAVSKNSNADHRGCEPLCFSSKRPVIRKLKHPTNSCDKTSKKGLRL